jgi:signal transduction histidine kinase
MPPDDKPRSPERSHTDESLRVERAKTDRALAEDLAAIDETADAVISKARARADEVLAAARAKTDRQSRPPDAQSPQTIEGKRVLEDQVIRGERASADETVRAERADHVAFLSAERGETDKDLLSERTRSDDALAERDSFLGVVSHDLRNMLNAIVGFAALIERDASREDSMREATIHAQRIQRSAARMNRLVGDLVDIACIEAGMLAVVREIGDPTRIVTEAVDTFQAQASANGVSLVAEIVRAPLAAFDPARILQVLTNLLTNAIKFTPTSGRVVVQVGPDGGEIRFAVRDTGAGIPTDQLEAVFERFLQVTKNDRRGVGLGLYISKCIIQGHGGRIWAESRVGEGSTFCFTLPIHVTA